jgi:hypothetical protein
MPSRQAARKRSFLGIGTLALTVLVALVPIQAAQAYIDPNSAGPLYQLLFPLFIAIASTLTALRRYIGGLWSRLTSAVTSAVRGGRVSSDTDKLP